MRCCVLWQPVLDIASWLQIAHKAPVVMRHTSSSLRVANIFELTIIVQGRGDLVEVATFSGNYTVDNKIISFEIIIFILRSRLELSL